MERAEPGKASMEQILNGCEYPYGFILSATASHPGPYPRKRYRLAF